VLEPSTGIEVVGEVDTTVHAPVFDSRVGRHVRMPSAAPAGAAVVIDGRAEPIRSAALAGGWCGR
jgi:hypothetical protein